MAGAFVLSPTNAASQEPVAGSAQRVVVARARAPRDAAVQRCLEYLGSEHPYFDLEGSARSVVQFEGVLSEAAPCVAYAPVDFDGILLTETGSAYSCHIQRFEKNLFRKSTTCFI